MKPVSWKHGGLLFERWSVSVSLFCYVGFFCVIWMRRDVPLKSKPQHRHISMKVQTPEEMQYQFKMMNDNFNSDKKPEDALLNEKTEYLVNVNDHENLHKNRIQILMDVFTGADRDKNKRLDLKELSHWIRLKIVEHISSAVRNNYGLFTIIDINPKNGVVSWKEYHAYFLKKRGFSNNYVSNHDEMLHTGLKRLIKEQIMKDKASFSEAARSNPDWLTLDEFLSFTHPESSAANQLALVDELYDKFDRDGDGLLTEDEFAYPLTDPGGGDVPMIVYQDGNERRAEFRKSVDLNGDGTADRRELLHYVAPQSPRHSEHEAEALLALADSDRDNLLSLDEMLAHSELFLKSKMVDTARSFHDEF